MTLFDRVDVSLGDLECTEDPPPQLDRVVEGLHPGSEEGELLVPEVRLGHACGDDQAVVGIVDRHAAGDGGVDHLAVEVETGHLGQLHPYVLRPADDVPERRGDLARGEHPGRRLVQEWLEQVMVAPVDERHVDRRTPEQPGCGEAAKPPSDDDHPVEPGAPIGPVDAVDTRRRDTGPSRHRVRAFGRLVGGGATRPRPKASIRPQRPGMSSSCS